MFYIYNICKQVKASNRAIEHLIAVSGLEYDLQCDMDGSYSNPEVKAIIDKIYNMRKDVKEGQINAFRLTMKEKYGSPYQLTLDRLEYIKGLKKIDKYDALLHKAKTYMNNKETKKSLLNRYLGIGYKDTQVIEYRLRYTNQIGDRNTTMLYQMAKSIEDAYDNGEGIEGIVADCMCRITNFTLCIDSIRIRLSHRPELVDKVTEIYYKNIDELKRLGNCWKIGDFYVAYCKGVNFRNIQALKRDNGKTCDTYEEQILIRSYITDIMRIRLQGGSLADVRVWLCKNADSIKKLPSYLSITQAIFDNREKYIAEDIFYAITGCTVEEFIEMYESISHKISKSKYLFFLRQLKGKGLVIPKQLTYLLEYISEYSLKGSIAPEDLD